MARKRLIRKQPLLERIRAYPFDLLLLVNEARLSIDWDDYVPHTFPIGTAVSVAFTVFCKLHYHYTMTGEKRDNQLFRTDYSTYQHVVSRAINGVSSEPISVSYGGNNSTKHFAWALHTSLVVIFLYSLLNAVNVFFFPYRDYSLLNLSASSPRPKGSNVVRRSVSNVSKSGVFGKLMSYFEEKSFYETDSESEADTTYEVKVVEKDIWVLKVWDPSHFQLYMAASCSPVVLMMVWLTSNTVSFWKMLITILLSNSAAYALVMKFLQLVSDRQIVYQETFNEYNRKYVIPKTSVLKKNAMVDATHGPMAITSKVVHDDLIGQLQNEFAFVTHDINGNRIKSVRADNLEASRPASPSRQLDHSMVDHKSRYGSRQRYYDDTESQSWITLSTPYYLRGGESFLHRNESFARHNDTFSRGDTFSRNESFLAPSSRAHSPAKTPSRFPFNANLSYSQRTQLSPSRSSRHSSPQRSPSPSKRPWL